jgi:hypothetical protein
MHTKYFPACTVKGPIEPAVPFGHMFSRGAVPNKCSSCQHLFEGECTRASEYIGKRYLHLDHGPCGIDGPTDPVYYENEFVTAKVSVPRKCVRCRFLKHDFLKQDTIGGFHCDKDAQIWGDFHRSLDWGAWVPERIYFQLPFPKITTRALSEFAYQDDLIGFIKEHRRVNPALSPEEAKKDFRFFREKIEAK